MIISMETNNIILDSNILFAYYVVEDSFHDKAIAIMQYIDENNITIFVHYGVLLEVSTLLSRRYGKKYADAFVWDCLWANNIVILSPNAHQDAERFLSHDDRMAFVDHILIHLAQEYRSMLLTFDEQLQKRYISGW